MYSSIASHHSPVISTPLTTAGDTKAQSSHQRAQQAGSGSVIDQRPLQSSKVSHAPGSERDLFNLSTSADGGSFVSELLGLLLSKMVLL